MISSSATALSMVCESGETSPSAEFHGFICSSPGKKGGCSHRKSCKGRYAYVTLLTR